MITLERAIDILEINDITSIKVEDLPKIEKRAKKRWHPDTIAASKPSQEIINKYEENFKDIKDSVALVYKFLTGEYHSGEKVKYTSGAQKEPEEIIRENAKDIQQELNDLWPFVQEKSYKKTIEEVVISPGDKLKDLLNEDFKDHTSFFSLASFFFSTFLFLILFLIGLLFQDTQFGKGYSFLLYFWYGLQTIACIFGLLPLSRFWLPPSVSQVMVGMINFGMGIYHWYEDELSDKWYFQILFNVPIIVAKTAEYVILYPLYELAKAIWGEKVVRRIIKKQAYYAGGADWYIEQLIQKEPGAMTRNELFDLSYLHREFVDVKSKCQTDSQQVPEVREETPVDRSKSSPDFLKWLRSNRILLAASLISTVLLFLGSKYLTRERLAGIEQKSEPPSSGRYVVNSTRAHFYDSPDPGTIRKGYVLQGDEIDVFETKDGFGYSSYTSSSGEVTSGWLKLESMQKLSDSGFRSDSVHQTSLENEASMNENRFIIDTYLGTIGDKEFKLFIEKVDGEYVEGYNVTGTNKRPIKGRIVSKMTKPTGLGGDYTIFKLILTEPGDDKWEGEFNIDLWISDQGRHGSGSWKSFNGSLERHINLKDKDLLNEQ